jgi:asparagine N-glycosylation enzyme membrane subunit Stt3
MAGEALPPDAPPGSLYILHTGLTYPLVYIAKAIGSLDFVGRFLPPLLGVISLVVIYLVATRIYNRRVGLLSSLAWALILNAVLIGAAGFLDRDGLSLLLIMTGAFLFYLSRGWQLRVGGRDIGWLVAGLAVIGIEGIIYAEWMTIGVLILVAILIAYVLGRFMMEYSSLLKTEPSMIRRLTAATRAVNWRTFLLVIGFNIVIAAVRHSEVAYWWNVWSGIVRGTYPFAAAEMQALGLLDLLNYHFFLIPIVIGVYLAFRRRDEGGFFFSCWFLMILFASLFAKRLFLYALPAACILAGVGLDSLWVWGRWALFRPLLKKLVVVDLFIFIILFSVFFAYLMDSTPGISVDKDWYEAMVYLKENSPENAEIMTWWGYGYWILDLAQRRPTVDNGFYGWDTQKLTDVRTVYLSTDSTEAVQVMETYGADYLIFSKIDEYSAPGIIAWPDDPKQVNGEWPKFPEDSLVARSLNDDFQSEGALKVVYRNDGVVILGLAQP